MPIVADYCLETTLTEGQGTYALEGAPAGKQRIVDGVGDGEGGFFIARGNPGEVNANDKEIFWGVAASGSPHTLTRVTIFKSTDSDQKIAWGAGVKTIYSIPPGELISELAEGGYSASGTRPATVTARGHGHWIDGSVSPRIAYWYSGTADIPKYLIDETANTVSLVGSGALLTSTDDGAGAGPTSELFRDSESSTDGDLLGERTWTARSDAGTKRTVARILAELLDAEDGAEDAALAFETIVAGALTRVVTINGSGIEVNGSQVTPVGAVLPFAGDVAPTGWLLCYGQPVSRTTYAALFDVVGTTYGIGDGSTTFNLPDLRGRVAAGKDDMGGSGAGRLTDVLSGGVDGETLGAAGGEQGHVLTVAELAAHAHTERAPVVSGSFESGVTPRQIGADTLTGLTGDDAAHNTVQPTIILNYIIRT
jgi:microcystin-dependent protein